VELEAVKIQMARSSAVATKDTSSTATPDCARTITNAPILMLVQMDSASIYQASEFSYPALHSQR